ncbi:hypothetical protein GJ744_007396 [Endocarpon pusillum]|uniref:Uncharacterized protein n=1 Tax=Endocarpon pusillum TaxID=364733 RepID=A0A8H7ARM2_9EURO|nr:hypothetical protein GJ744_007396 [Endocarpon pusillum]
MLDKHPDQASGYCCGKSSIIGEHVIGGTSLLEAKDRQVVENLTETRREGIRARDTLASEPCCSGTCKGAGKSNEARQTGESFDALDDHWRNDASKPINLEYDVL